MAARTADRAATAPKFIDPISCKDQKIMLSSDIQNLEIRFQIWRFGVVLRASDSCNIAEVLRDLRDQAEALEIAALPNGAFGVANATCVSDPLEALRGTFADMAYDQHELKLKAVEQFRLVLKTAQTDAEALEACAKRCDLPEGIADIEALRKHPGRIVGFISQPAQAFRPAPTGPGEVA